MQVLCYQLCLIISFSILESSAFTPTCKHFNTSDPCDVSDLLAVACCLFTVYRQKVIKDTNNTPYSKMATILVFFCSLN